MICGNVATRKGALPLTCAVEHEPINNWHGGVSRKCRKGVSNGGEVRWDENAHETEVTLCGGLFVSRQDPGYNFPICNVYKR